MRFIDVDMELRFLEMQAELLGDACFWCSIACSFMFFAFTALVVCKEGTTCRPDATWRLNLVAAAACTGISTLVTTAAKMPDALVVLTPRMREFVTVNLTLLLGVLQFAIDPWYGARLLREERGPAWFNCHGDHFSDTMPVLVLTTLVIGSHLAMPIRWICLLPLVMALGLVYATFAFLLGGPDAGQAWSAALLLHAIIFCTSIGRRTLENHQRRTFCLLDAGRNLPAQPESRAEEPDTAGHELEGGPYTSELSRPETSASYSAFEIQGEAQRAACLEKLVDIGRREKWYVHVDELHTSARILGEGAYGVVLAGEYHGSPVAIKVGKPDMWDRHADMDRIKSLLNEVRVLRHLRHPNIVQLRGACLDVNTAEAIIVLERVFGKNLEKVILEGGQAKEQLQTCDRLSVLVDISRALRYIHSRNPRIVHGDLKAANIAVEELPGMNGVRHAKLLDFGLARVLTKHAKPLGGTLMWVAPEVVQYPDRPPQVHADVFSFGRVAFFVLTGTMALADDPRRKIIDDIKQGCLPALPWPHSNDPSLETCREHVDLCVAFQASLRPSMKAVSSFFASRLEENFSNASNIGMPTCRRVAFPEQEDLEHGVPNGSFSKARSGSRGHFSGSFAGQSSASVAPSTIGRHTLDAFPIVPGISNVGGPIGEDNSPSLQPAVPGCHVPGLPPQPFAHLQGGYAAEPLAEHGTSEHFQPNNPSSASWDSEQAGGNQQLLTASTSGSRLCCGSNGEAQTID